MEKQVPTTPVVYIVTAEVEAVRLHESFDEHLSAPVATFLDESQAQEFAEQLRKDMDVAVFGGVHDRLDYLPELRNYLRDEVLEGGVYDQGNNSMAISMYVFVKELPIRDAILAPAQVLWPAY